MEKSILEDFYLQRGLGEEETAEALRIYNSFQNWIDREKGTSANCSVEQVKAYIRDLTSKKENSHSNLLALARIFYLAENREAYIYFTQIIERKNIISNIRQHMDKVLGAQRTEEIFSPLTQPPEGAPPEEAVQFTQKLVRNLESELSEKECRKALTANAHGIAPEAFETEAELFRKAADLRIYLKESHDRIVAKLQEHKDSGKIWFEQIITQPVVEYVRKNSEVLAGDLVDDKIYWTKIPYDVEAWLNETDRQKKRYYACHCPMAREVLNQPGEKIPRSWCNCTSGFIGQRFNAIFGEEVPVDLIESVLDGNDRCRFAIHVPAKYQPLPLK